VTLAGNHRLPVFRQEFPYRHLWEWTTLAENQWPLNGRKLTRHRGLVEDHLGAKLFSLGHVVGD